MNMAFYTNQNHELYHQGADGLYRKVGDISDATLTLEPEPDVTNWNELVILEEETGDFVCDLSLSDEALQMLIQTGLRTVLEEMIDGETFQVDKIIFNDPATVVVWQDGSKTVVKAMEEDVFQPEVGFAMAVMKKAFGSHCAYKRFIKEWIPRPKPSLKDDFEGRTITLSDLKRDITTNLELADSMMNAMGFKRQEQQVTSPNVLDLNAKEDDYNEEDDYCLDCDQEHCIDCVEGNLFQEYTGE